MRKFTFILPKANYHSAQADHHSRANEIIIPPKADSTHINKKCKPNSACIFYYKLIIKSPINVIAMLIPDLSVSFSLKRNADIKVPIAIVPPWLRV